MIKTLFKWTPNWVKKKFHTLLIFVLKEQHKRHSQKPNLTLERKHISNTLLLIDRKELLNHLPKNGVVAELGVNRGDFSSEIFKICQPKKLHLVDTFESKIRKQEVENRFQKEIENKIILLESGFSTEIATHFPDNYFDWIYIDTDHSYETTAAELRLYLPKMKSGGIIAGHDFIIGNWNGMVRYGVIEAVYEFCIKHDWGIKFLTTEMSEHPSFALKKIGLNAA